VSVVTLIELVALGAIWGASFLFMRIAAPDVGAAPLVELRMVLGALTLLPFLWRERARIPTMPWARLTGIGLLNSAAPFLLYAWASQHAPAGISAITNATVVMFAALFAWTLYGERIGLHRALGLVAGFIGVAVLASGRVAGESVWPAALAGLFGALLYGLSVNLIRHHLRELPASATAGATLLGPALLTAPFAAAYWPQHHVAARSWAAAALLGVLCTGAAYVIYYRLIHRIGAPRAAAVTYLIPLFGVLWAWLVLGEPLTPTMAVSGALILGGVALSQRA
jgi:drug/metabolite transporter (DMT)-like permease